MGTVVCMPGVTREELAPAPRPTSGFNPRFEGVNGAVHERTTGAVLDERECMLRLHMLKLAVRSAVEQEDAKLTIGFLAQISELRRAMLTFPE